MLLNKTHKIAVFLVPRTGSFTLYSICRNNIENFNICLHEHRNFDFFWENYSGDISDEDLKEYRCFAFYRNPIDRAISLYRHFKRKHWVPFYFYFYGKLANDVSTLDRTPYDKLNEELKAKIDRISIDEFWHSNFYKDKINLDPQTNWLNYPFMNLLNFHDYENQVKWLLNEMNINVTSIPLYNQSERHSEADDPQWSTIEKIIEIYQCDFDFLASRGIFL